MGPAAPGSPGAAHLVRRIVRNGHHHPGAACDAQGARACRAVLRDLSPQCRFARAAWRISPENVFTIRDTSLFALGYDTLAFLAWTRRKGIDTVVDFELFSRFTALISGLAGADRRVGFHRFHNEGLFRGEMLTHRVAYNPHIHIAKNLIALVDALFAAVPQIPYSKTVIGDDQLDVAIPPARQEARDSMLARVRATTLFDPARQSLVLVNPNASELLPHRRWMPERYAELIRRLLAERDDIVVAITGAPGERHEAEALAAASGARCISLAGKTALAELPALYAHAALMVATIRARAFRGRHRPADHCAVRARNAAALPAARHVARNLCGACLLTLCQRAQSPQDRLYRQCLHAGDQCRSGPCRGRRGSRRRR